MRTSSGSAGPRPEGESRRGIWLVAAALAAGVVLAYTPGLPGPFLFDDLPAIVENASIRSLWPPGAVLFPEQAGGITTSGRPLVNLTLALNYAIGGTGVWSYHAFNLGVHLAVALALFGLVRRTLHLPLLAARLQGRTLLIAGAAALLWALHPLPSGAVVYVVQRAEALAALFLVLTLYAFVRGAQSRAGDRWRWAGVVACLLGMACKETMAVAPVLLLLYDRTFVSGTFRAAWERHGRWHVAAALTWLLLGALVLGTGGNRGGTAGLGTEMSVWSYALTQCGGLVRYAGLAVWPHPLVFDYGLATVRSPVEVLPQALLVLTALGGTVFALVRRPAAGFLGAWFFILLAPSSSFVPIATQTLAEHRMYLPLAAIIVAGTLALAGMLGRRAIGPLVLAGVAFAIGTARRSFDYRSELAIWSDTAAKFPGNARAHNNLGQALFRAGRLPEAVASYERALARQPKYPETHYNLGVARMQAGDVPRAIAHYEEALRHQPDYPEALNNLGNALLRAGRPAEALRRYEEAVARRPAFAEAQNNLGNALLQEGRVAEARARFEQALRLRPDDAEARYNLGNALAAAGDMTAALAQYLHVLRQEPRHVAAQVNAGNALLELRRPAEALARYEAALAIDPAQPDASYNRGSVLLDLGRAAEAVTAFEAVLRANPEAAKAHGALAAALAQTGRVAEAVTHYEHYLKAHPEDGGARAEWSRLRASLGRPVRE